MTNINKPIINYTAKDFASIKKELVNYTKRYYPDTYRDFNEASFGSLLLDMVSYVGDMTSFYADYQANESFLETAMEFKNVLKLSKQIGYKFRPNASSFGEISFFVTIPSKTNTVTPDYSYAPILKKGSTFSSKTGTLFTLVEDVDFSNTSDEVLVASSTKDGTAPARYALKARGVVVSGELYSQVFTIGDYKKFLKLKIFDPYLTEIVQVYDSNGNNYYEVDYLSQDVLYVPILNTRTNKKYAKNILKPISVPRRFVAEHASLYTLLQFGYGTEDNEEKALDPASVALEVFGKTHIKDKSFDPAVLTKTTKLGVVPTNTALTVIYRRNSKKTINVPAGSLSKKNNPKIKFIEANNLDLLKRVDVVNSLELTNESSISGELAGTSADEIRLRAQGTYAAQNRAVTKDDYINICYNMPSNFGTVKRVSMSRDETSFNGKNLNLSVLSVDNVGKYIPTNKIIKQNLRTWINKYKMMGDTIDILDAKIINLQIKFSIIAFANINRYDAMNDCLNALSTYYNAKYYDIEEPFKITDIYKLLNNLPTVVDTKSVEVTPNTLGNRSKYSVPYEELISTDGRYLIPPRATVFEIKDVKADITGEVI
jgi:hypothetical protein